MVAAPAREMSFTAVDSVVRLQRMQAVCKALDVDALLFVGGVDGRDNLGSVQALNYLLGGRPRHAVLFLAQRES